MTPYDAASRPTERDREALVLRLEAMMREQIGDATVGNLTRRQIGARVAQALEELQAATGLRLGLQDQRAAVEHVTGRLEPKAPAAPGPVSQAPPQPGASAPAAAEELRTRLNDRVQTIRLEIQPMIMERIDVTVAARLSHGELEAQIRDVVTDLQAELKLQLNGPEHAALVRQIVDDLVGLGPLEPLLADETVTDIMVNGAKQIYVERRGRLELTNVTFRDDRHVMNVATRIVSRIGRRVDEASPLVDARLQDGSRVNIIIPPLAIDGPSISIRKFSKRHITLDIMARQGNISESLASVLKIAGRCRLNVIISGGTGSGKTTLLNAMSRMIDHGERVVTIEDAAELQLQQPHVVRLETRTASLEGTGEITMRDLVKNALRMRPDRIILGEVRGAEAIDVLQAMNTGHDGSMSTLHANTPREALTRLENMVAMSSLRLPTSAVRHQISSAVNLIVQVSRMRDGMRRVTHVTEVTGMEGEVITLQDLFVFQFQGERSDGTLIGRHLCTGYRPNFLPRAEYFGLGEALMGAMECLPPS